MILLLELLGIWLLASCIFGIGVGKFIKAGGRLSPFENDPN